LHRGGWRRFPCQPQPVRLLKLKQIIDYVISISKYTQSVKFIMKELGLCNELCRPPYLNLNLDEKKKLKKYLNLILK